ncbi:hypothetical protein DSO57_1039232 [Entomophthora muscae]|uniref:Uncharacterized protein n=1 Tax=Entomophthora muscae TaxID=34485 RepID=A0ACC2U823_9FUNG|nr:hypothetical protein DSO57_1039232 [Entomophthora muscae]
MSVQPASTHHIIVSSISGIPIASVYQGIQASTTPSYYAQLVCDDQIIVLSAYDLRNAKCIFDALCLALGRDRFAISFCSSAMYNKVSPLGSADFRFFQQSLVPLHPKPSVPSMCCIPLTTCRC